VGQNWARPHSWPVFENKTNLNYNILNFHSEIVFLDFLESLKFRSNGKKLYWR
jgi:hypothetical protein